MRVAAIASFLALSTATAAAASADDNTSSGGYRVNGWYPCAFSSKTDSTKYGTEFKSMTVFECAEIEVPLCYDGVCDSDYMIDVFVKRMRGKAETPKGEKRRALVLAQGGPGDSSVSMESSITSLLGVMNGTVDYYTFDHRGTGRSEFVQCDAAQALTDGSPEGNDISTEELGLCIQDLNFQYGDNAAAFSTTSAAMDVRAIIETFMADNEVHILGYSYGTFLLQRILQLQIPQVVGYIFDSVDALTPHGKPIEAANSNWNQALHAPARRLLEACFDHPECPLKFQSRETVVDEVLALYAHLDKNQQSPCSKLLLEIDDESLPSETIRSIVSASDVGSRVKALHTLALLKSCKKEDVETLRNLHRNRLGKSHVRSLDPIQASSPLLYNIIVSSERWAQPSPTVEQRNEWYSKGPFSLDMNDFEVFCIITGAKDPACSEYKEMTKGKPTFYYEHDKYFDMPLVIPDHASVMILAGGLDFATPLEFSEVLYGRLEGGRGQMMVTFDYGTHCNGEATELNQSTPCYDSLIANFVKANGDVTAVDTSCMETIPDMSFAPAAEEDEEEEEE